MTYLLESCSPSIIINGIIDLLDVISTHCSSLSMEYLKEELDKLRILKKEYLENCYHGSFIERDMLCWLSVAEKGLESCISIKLSKGDVSVAETLQLIRFIVELNRLLKMDASSISKILEEKSDHAKEIKKLYLAGIGDIIKRVNDESIKHVLESLWRSLECDLKRGVEKYAVEKGLVELALRIEMLLDGGLSLENLLNQLIKSELKSLINEIELAIERRNYGSETLSRITGYLKRILALTDLARTLGFQQLKSLDNEFNQLRSFEYLLSLETSITSIDILENLKNTLSKIHSFLG